MTGVAELEGADLDYWVAKAIGLSPEMKFPALGDGVACWLGYFPDPTTSFGSWWSPSSHWNQGGPLIWKHWITIDYDNEPEGDEGSQIVCHCPRQIDGIFYDHVGRGEAWEQDKGEPVLTAACRAIVASVYGEETPDE